MPILGSGGAMRRPVWAALIGRSADYDNERVVIVDTQTYLDLLGRGAKRAEVPGLDRWNDELSWLFNSAPSEVRIKLNQQVYEEMAGASVTAKAPGLAAEQKAFIDHYRRSGKIIFDTGSVPFFAAARMSLYMQVVQGLRASGNIGAGDLLIAADGLVNRLWIISQDWRFIDGMDKALRGKVLRGVLKAHGLADDIAKVFISPTRSAL